MKPFIKLLLLMLCHLLNATFVNIDEIISVPSSKEINVNTLSGLTSSILVLAAGQGTTGTHSIFHELCEMNLKSVHYRTGCRGVSVKMEVDLKNTDRDLANMLRKVQFQGVEAVIDSPVAYVFNELYISSPNAKVILSVRDPDTWVLHRLEDHPHALVCRESVIPPLIDSYASSNAGSTINKIGPPPQPNEAYPSLPHPFALRICMQRASYRQITKYNNSTTTTTTTTNNTQVNSKDAVIGIADYLSMAEEVFGIGNRGRLKARNILAQAFTQYNDYIRSVVPPHNLLEVDLWNDDACEFHDKIELFLNRSLHPKFRGSIVGMKIGKEMGERICKSCT
jgi:hypothetical protein